MSALKNKVHITLLPQEEVLSVQRQHWLALLFSLAFHLLIIIVLAITAVFFIHQQYPSIFFLALISFSLLLLSFLAVVGTFAVTDWYYTFYIITNKRIINEHFFRLAGAYYEEVFLEEEIESVDRIEKNILYDFLGVEDVLVHFPTFRRDKPFLFNTPENAREIEHIIEGFCVKKGGQ